MKCYAPSASSGSRDRAHQLPSLRVGRRLGDHPHDRLRARRPNVHPPVRPRQPEAILRVGRSVRERRAQCLVHRYRAERPAGRACPSRSRTAAARRRCPTAARPPRAAVGATAPRPPAHRVRGAPPGESRRRCLRRRSGALSSRMRTATFTSPTGARITGTPAAAATSSTIRLVERFVTTAPRPVPQHHPGGQREREVLADRLALVRDQRQPVDVGIDRKSDRGTAS